MYGCFFSFLIPSLFDNSKSIIDGAPLIRMTSHSGQDPNSDTHLVTPSPSHWWLVTPNVNSVPLSGTRSSPMTARGEGTGGERMRRREALTSFDESRIAMTRGEYSPNGNKRQPKIKDPQELRSLGENGTHARVRAHTHTHTHPRTDRAAILKDGVSRRISVKRLITQ